MSTMTMWGPSSEENTITLVIESNTDWSITSDPWIIIIGNTTGHGDDLITVKVEENPGGERVGNITIHGGTITRVLTITQQENGDVVGDISDDDAVDLALDWLTWNVIRNANILQTDVKSDLNLVTSGPEETVISWYSTNHSYVNPDGTVTRPTFTQGDQSISITAIITKGAAIKDVIFELIIPKLAQTDEELVEAVKTLLVWDMIRNKNILQEEVMTNLNLIEGLNGTTISWSSTAETVVATNGVVTRPDSDSPDANVDITATISKGSISDNTMFALKVLRITKKCSICGEDLDEDGKCPNQHVITNIPQQDGTITWNGDNQSPDWIGFDSSQLAIGGITSSTNAGIYNATFTPRLNWEWPDASTDPKNISWEILQATGTLELSSTSLTIEPLGISETITVTKNGDGELTAISSDTGVATVSISGNTITVNRHPTGYGTATITVSVTSTSNCSAVSKTCSITVEGVSGSDWMIQPNVTGNSWRSVCYGDGMFVAVAYTGDSDRVMTSPDGITWTSQSGAINSSNWAAVCYGDGLFVVVGNSGAVMTSPDGINWTSRISSDNNNWHSVCYSEELGLFVAASYTNTGNQIMTSSDGIEWIGRNVYTTTNIQSICYGNGKFVTVGNNATNSDGMSNSYDGINWSRGSTGNDGLNWTSVCYGDGIFVAVAAVSLTLDNDHRVMRSAGGAWINQLNTILSNWRSVCYGDGLFVVVADSGTNRIMISPDGLTWTAKNVGTSNQWQSVCYGNGKFVAVGTNGSVMTSP